MIDEIQVQNLALIREATLQPCAGLTVLTGETGAGKTALLSALKLLMGVRASADLVRDGESELQVSGRFFGLDGQESADEEKVVSRKVSAEGRSRATINGSMASVGELAHLVAPSVDLCGQFEHQQLMRPATHVELLDAWAGDQITAAYEAYRAALDEAQQAAAHLAEVSEAQELSSAKLDDARFVLARIDEVNPQEGEYEQLAHDLELAENAEALVMATAGAHAALSDDGGALDALNTAAAALESVGRVDNSLAQLGESLRQAGFVLEDVSAQARDYRDRLDFDAEQLAAQQERFASMQGLMRSYGPTMQDVLDRREEAAQLVQMADGSQEFIRAAQQRYDAAEAQLAQAADALDAAREQAMPRFADEVTQVMRRLQMDQAHIVCSNERGPRESWNSAGPSHFEFLYCPTEASHPRPLARIASGGEVSRVMLAVKVVLGATDNVQTLVFDEVDAGVGGAVAVSLAEELARLAQTHQVIVVTHLAQVAVRGHAHYVVQRHGDETTLTQVEDQQREQEIARMLSGSATETSLAHARELLASV